MVWQVIEIINELVKITAGTRHGSFWLYVDEESTETVCTICDANPQAKNKCRALRGN
jgi:hypothetical protein